MRSGEYKVSFVLPIFEHTKNVLFAGVEMSDLAEKLVALGLDVVSGPMGEGVRFDLVVAGGIPRRELESRKYFADLSTALADSGHVAFILPNRFGLSRLFGAARGGGTKDNPARPASSGAAQSLRNYLRAIRAYGFETIGVYSPIPDIRNPVVFVPVADARPFAFLLSYFSDFSTNRSAIAMWIARILIRLGAYKHLMNWYIIVARKGGARE